MNEKEIKGTAKRLLEMYAYSMAASSMNVKKISDIKIKKQDIKNELIYLHYRMIDKSSILNSQTHSAALFKALYSDIKQEHIKNVQSYVGKTRLPINNIGIK